MEPALLRERERDAGNVVGELADDVQRAVTQRVHVRESPRLPEMPGAASDLHPVPGLGRDDREEVHGGKRVGRGQRRGIRHYPGGAPCRRWYRQ